MAKEVSFNFKRGDTKRIKFGITDKEGQPIEFGATDEIYFTLKKSEDAKDNILQKKLSNASLEYVDGKIIVLLSHKDTNELPTGTYRYDIQISLSNNEYVETIFEGDIELEKDVTRN